MTSDENERLNAGVFRYTDLPAELRQIIIQEFILSAQEDDEKLSKFACMSCEWQLHIEKVTFARLGKDPRPHNLLHHLSDPEGMPSSPFQATHLRDFERIVVGARRANLHHIFIDFHLDEEGMPEVGAMAPPTTDYRALRRATNTRRCQRFTDYMRELFCILHAWNDSQIEPSYLDVKIRVRDIAMDHMTGQFHDELIHLREDFKTLPNVCAIRTFEIISEPSQEKHNWEMQEIFYVPPGCVNDILSRLPLLHSATLYIDFAESMYPDTSDSDQLCREYLLRIDLTRGKLMFLSKSQSNADRG